MALLLVGFLSFAAGLLTAASIFVLLNTEELSRDFKRATRESQATKPRRAESAELDDVLADASDERPASETAFKEDFLFQEGTRPGDAPWTLLRMRTDAHQHRATRIEATFRSFQEVNTYLESIREEHQLAKDAMMRVIWTVEEVEEGRWFLLRADCYETEPSIEIEYVEWRGSSEEEAMRRFQEKRENPLLGHPLVVG